MSKLVIIGERLNSSRKAVLKAFQDKNEQFIINEAKKQKEAGANYLDVNASMMMEKEIETLKWVIPLIQNEIDIAIAIDTPDAAAMEAGLKAHKGRALINSFTGEKQSFKKFAPLVKKYNAKAIVMCLDEQGIIQSAISRFLVAIKIIEQLQGTGVDLNDIFIDPIVRPIGIDANNGVIDLDSLRLMKSFLPSIKTLAGISNVSFGMPERQLLNRVFLTLAIHTGLDAAIIDPLDKNIMEAIVTAETLLGKDPSCKNYLDYIRKKNKNKK